MAMNNPPSLFALSVFASARLFSRVLNMYVRLHLIEATLPTPFVNLVWKKSNYIVHFWIDHERIPKFSDICLKRTCFHYCSPGIDQRTEECFCWKCVIKCPEFDDQYLYYAPGGPCDLKFKIQAYKQLPFWKNK
jgi:hypothetical protein